MMMNVVIQDDVARKKYIIMNRQYLVISPLIHYTFTILYMYYTFIGVCYII